MGKSAISFSDFQKLDLRVGKVVFAEDVEKSKSLIKMRVDFGDRIENRIIFAGIKRWYRPNDLTGRKFIFVVNLEAKKMIEGESQGMMLAADSSSRAFLIPIDDNIKEGTVVR